jgi:hypothetical protein
MNFISVCSRKSNVNQNTQLFTETSIILTINDEFDIVAHTMNRYFKGSL